MYTTVLTPDREVFNGDIASVNVPGSQGAFEVLKNHAPIVSSLDAGQIKITTGSGEYTFFDKESNTMKTDTRAGVELTYAISGGFIEVISNRISLLVQGV
jgi:F-type H+-transporting ATPase subunit epsilon